MLALIRLPQADVLRLLAEDPTASVSPGSERGWTAAVVEDEDALPSNLPSILLDLDVEVTLVVRTDSRSTALRWVPASEIPRADELTVPPTIVDALTDVLELSPDHRDVLISRIAARPDPDDLAQDLGSAVGLPDIDPPQPRTAVVLAQIPEKRMRAAGSLATATLVPVELSALDDGWSLLQPTTDAETSDELAIIVGTALQAGNLGHRRRRVLLLWRGEGATSGAMVFHRSRMLASMVWSSSWTEPALSGWEVRDEITEEFARLSRDRPVDSARLRALFRSDDVPGDPLTTLVDVLGVPPEAIAALDRTPSAPARETPAPVGFWRYLWALLNGADSSERIPRSWAIGFGALALVVTGVFAVMLALGIAVLATDGSVVDEHGSTIEDRVATAVFAVATLVHLMMSIRFFRLGRRDR
ncbi:hypothetical protein ACFSDA_01960 [Brachybacterium rhamnosum]|uniref:Uncharacterized protein n=1 Tax=Brachybacterium rhamnosum TaxID=173361 RepID=A0ABW4PVK2_9MICO